MAAILKNSYDVITQPGLTGLDKINQSINLICIRQPKPVVAKPNICKNKKETQHYNTTQLLPHRQTQEKGNQAEIS